MATVVHAHHDELLKTTTVHEVQVVTGGLIQ